MSRITLVLDSSQITAFLECERKWKLQYDELLTSSNIVREDMAMGTYGHKLLEIYYKSLANGSKITDAVSNALSSPIDTPHQMDENNIYCTVCDSLVTIGPCSRFPLSNENRAKVRDRFNDYWMTYSKNDIIPARGNAKHQITFTNGYPKDSWIEEPLVEQGFSYVILDSPDYLFVVEGRVDLIGDWCGRTCFMDHKFQSRERELYDHSIQFRNYSLATGIPFGVINYVRLHKSISSSTLERQLIWLTPLERESWLIELINIYKEIARCMSRGEWFKRRSSCDGKFGYKCEFTRICDEPLIEISNNLKQQSYVKREKWLPWRENE